MPWLCICYAFCFCDILLFASGKCCFSFFMVTIALSVDQRISSDYFRACGLWNASIPIFEGNFY